MPLSDRWQIEDIKARVPLADLIGRDVPLVRRGNRLWACCPFHVERTPSFTLKGGFYKCFGCGASGDHFSWMRDFHRMDFKSAKAELARLAGTDLSTWDRPDAAAQRLALAERQQELAEKEERLKLRKVEQAAEIWRACVPLAGTLAEVYLRQRGIPAAGEMFLPTLRFHPALRHDYTGARHPAMVACMQGPERTFSGVHRTYLAPDGTAKLNAVNPRDGKPVPAKLMLGAAWRSSVRFARAGEMLAIGEGIETCLSIMLDRPDLAVWAALSLGNIAGEGVGRGPPHPERPGMRLPSVNPDPDKPGIMIPECVRHVLLLADNDNKDPESAQRILARAANRWRAEGREVSIATPPRGMDFNDFWLSLRHKGATA